MSERHVELTVPLPLLSLLLDLRIDLAGVSQPGPTEILVVSVTEETEEQGVDGHAVLVGKIADDALRTIVELTSDEYQFVRLVQRLRHGCRLEFCTERLVERRPRMFRDVLLKETFEDGRNIVVLQRTHP